MTKIRWCWISSNLVGCLIAPFMMYGCRPVGFDLKMICRRHDGTNEIILASAGGILIRTDQHDGTHRVGQPQACGFELQYHQGPGKKDMRTDGRGRVVKDTGFFIQQRREKDTLAAPEYIAAIHTQVPTTIRILHTDLTIENVVAEDHLLIQFAGEHRLLSVNGGEVKNVQGDFFRGNFPDMTNRFWRAGPRSNTINVKYDSLKTDLRDPVFNPLPIDSLDNELAKRVPLLVQYMSRQHTYPDAKLADEFSILRSPKICTITQQKKAAARITSTYQSRIKQKPKWDYDVNQFKHATVSAEKEIARLLKEVRQQALETDRLSEECQVQQSDNRYRINLPNRVLRDKDEIAIEQKFKAFQAADVKLVQKHAELTKARAKHTAVWQQYYQYLVDVEQAIKNYDLAKAEFDAKQQQLQSQRAANMHARDEAERRENEARVSDLQRAIAAQKKKDAEHWKLIRWRKHLDRQAELAIINANRAERGEPPLGLVNPDAGP